MLGWGPQGEQVHAEAVQLQLPLVQAPVQGHDLVGLGLGALGERLDGEVDHLLGEARHGQDAIAEIPQFLVELTHQPNLPVM